MNLGNFWCIFFLIKNFLTNLETKFTLLWPLCRPWQPIYQKNGQKILYILLNIFLNTLLRVHAFFLGESYLAEQFRQITHYLAEQFRQITHYLAEQFRQIAHYLAEHLIQKEDILFNKKFLTLWMQECKNAGMHESKYASIKVWKYASMQIYNDASIQVCSIYKHTINKYTSW